MTDGNVSAIVALLTLVVTLLAIWVAWHLGRRYDEHIKELAGVRADHERLSLELTKANNLNRTAVVQWRLSQKLSYQLIMSQKRGESIAGMRDELLNSSTWNGTRVDKDRSIELLAGVDLELKRISTETRAREQDLTWLLAEPHEAPAILQSIVNLHGDDETLRILERMCDLQLSDDMSRELITAKTALEGRLGRGFQAKMYTASSWTGMS